MKIILVKIHLNVWILSLIKAEMASDPTQKLPPSQLNSNVYAERILSLDNKRGFMNRRERAENKHKQLNYSIMVFLPLGNPGSCLRNWLWMQANASRNSISWHFLETGYWKQAFVTPLYKRGARYNSENYTKPTCIKYVINFFELKKSTSFCTCWKCMCTCWKCMSKVVTSMAFISIPFN